jgi:hypothetical protein
MKFFNKRAALGLLILGSVLPLSFAASAAAAPPVPLGTTGSFAILAGSGITNVPTSAISGNVGLSPTTGAAITGLGCVEVTGTIYKVDAAGDACFTNDPGLLTIAKSHLVLAFDNATAQTPTQDITGVNLSGQTYGAGVYSATGDILISGAAPLTLNGGGNADSVFIFQAAAGQNLSVVGTSNVVYTNGAQPCNVFWKVNSAFLSNTGFSFVGTILALQQITLTANITVEGRLLARNDNVTLISDTITRPSTCVLQADLDAAAAAQAAAAAAQAAAAAAQAAAAAAQAAAPALAATEAARVEAANAEAVKAEAARVEAAKVSAAVAAAKAVAAKAAAKKKVSAAKAAAAKKAAIAKKLASAKKVAAVKAAIVPGPVPSAGGSTSVSGPALPPVNPSGFTG